MWYDILILFITPPCLPLSFRQRRIRLGRKGEERIDNNKSMPGSETSTSIMFFYIYVLESLKNNELYIGFTDALRERIEKHNRGAVVSTKRYRPWRLIYYEACLNKQDAQRREKYFKTSQGRRLMKRRLKEYFYITNK